ncbi:unnamed protein product [Lactuca saligna]|uniref:Uncharacterized protein n=1 Tax=Lactuca saligna TaxID=75948 RepID=A0AA36E6R8_LACSI|nr:unnamed protein product [Lactuca saligna]
MSSDHRFNSYDLPHSSYYVPSLSFFHRKVLVRSVPLQSLGQNLKSLHRLIVHCVDPSIVDCNDRQNHRIKAQSYVSAFRPAKIVSRRLPCHTASLSNQVSYTDSTACFHLHFFRHDPILICYFTLRFHYSQRRRVRLILCNSTSTLATSTPDESCFDSEYI